MDTLSEREIHRQLLMGNRGGCIVLGVMPSLALALLLVAHLSGMLQVQTCGNHWACME